MYSPERRTAVVLAGTGAHGAYHAGVLRALEEAGVKVDVYAGHGVGAANAALAAIGGHARLWDASGVWRAPATRAWYGWKRSIRWAGWLVAGLATALIAPVALVVLTGIIVYPLGFLLETAGSGFGATLLSGYAGWLQEAFAGPRLPTFVPRVGMIVVSALAVLVFVAAIRAARAGWARRGRGVAWWWVFGAPFDAAPAREAFLTAHLGSDSRRGAGGTAVDAALGRRYTEVLLENLGQPGFRELIWWPPISTRGAMSIGALVQRAVRAALPGRAPRRRPARRGARLRRGRPRPRDRPGGGGPDAAR